jgi:hypothetical protein
LLALAHKITPAAHLENCTPHHHCLNHPPRIVVGGNGVSGESYIDNVAFRAYTYEAFGAEALAMESAAVAHVATVKSRHLSRCRAATRGRTGRDRENLSKGLSEGYRPFELRKIKGYPGNPGSRIERAGPIQPLKEADHESG